ncbi:uncharacterized protein LOC132272374 [Cornus florida]|uniref:uncharacterized protein LOC132272374 n=1 Tax=Cornus florida TaxID=4283 RepID=UPI00289F7A92|nr:uncharacterized protein LOC132272374 [Cornus florida]
MTKINKKNHLNLLRGHKVFLSQEENQEADDHPEQSGMSLSPSPSIIDTTTSELNPPPLTSSPNPRRRPNKRKKGSVKKQQAIEKKLQTLSENLKPIPFVPSKTLDVFKHEKLLKRLGLWDFVHIEFDRNIRVDLLVQLIANYDPKLRYSYVNGFRIAVNRADMARIFKLPVKKKKDKKGSSVSSSEAVVDLDSDSDLEESISFIADFVSNWVLLHEDTWMMPTDVLSWTRAIRDRHPEKVDWASLIWCMVEKELVQGQHLEYCYYASHLQYLIKSQREETLGVEPKDGGDVKIGASDNYLGQEDVILEEPDIELTLGQDNVEKEEQLKEDEELMDVEECKEQQHGHWLLDGKNNEGKHFLQHCSLEEGSRGLDSHWEGKQEDEEVEVHGGDGFDLMPNADALDGDGLTGNTRLLRTDGSWDQKSSDFGMCMEQVQQWMGKARMMYKVKEQACEESNMKQQYLLNELQQREGVIEHLHKVKVAEIKKRDREISRLEHDLYLMGNLLKGYRMALKETHKSFSEYRQRCQLPEEPLYEDAGPGGVMFSTMELEKRQKREEEERVMIEGKIMEFEAESIDKLKAHLDMVCMLDERLKDLSNEVKLLQELSAKNKVSETSGFAPDE